MLRNLRKQTLLCMSLHMLSWLAPAPRGLLSPLSPLSALGLTGLSTPVSVRLPRAPGGSEATTSLGSKGWEFQGQKGPKHHRKGPGAFGPRNV